MGADRDCTGRSCLIASSCLHSTNGRVIVVGLIVCLSFGVLSLG